MTSTPDTFRPCRSVLHFEISYDFSFYMYAIISYEHTHTVNPDLTASGKFFPEQYLEGFLDFTGLYLKPVLKISVFYNKKVVVCFFDYED